MLSLEYQNQITQMVKAHANKMVLGIPRSDCSESSLIWESLGLLCPNNSLIRDHLCAEVSFISQGHNLYKLQYISLEEVKIVSFQQ